MKQKYKEYLKLNKNVLLGFLGSIIVSAIAADYFGDQDDYLNTSLTLIIDYTMFFSIFGCLFYLDNRKKYVLSNGAGQEWNFTSSGSQIPTNTWTHVALVRRFGTDIKLYVNGTAIKTDTTSVSTTLGDSTGDFKIGFERFQGSGGGFNGYISNFRFVNGTAVYTGNFTTRKNIFRCS